MKPLRFGVIGTGRFGQHYMRLLSPGEGTELTATSHTTEETEKILRTPDIDAVVVATPVSTHAEITVAALQAGKHVLVEKPMVSTRKEVETVLEAAERGTYVLMVAHQYVYNDHVKKMKQLLQEEVLGKVLYISAEHMYPGPIRADVGCFLDAAVHELSILKYLFDVQKVTGVQGRKMSFGATAHEDFTSATVTFDSSLVVHLVHSRFAPEKKRQFTIVGERASLVFDDLAAEGKLKLVTLPYPKSLEHGAATSTSIEMNIKQVEVLAEEPLKNELEYFVQCVQDTTRPLTDAVFGAWVVGVAHDILEQL